MSAIKFNNTKWAVGAMENNGIAAPPHTTPWQFNDCSMNGGDIWYGGWKIVNENTIKCQILFNGMQNPVDNFEVVFLNDNFFIATKDSNIYRFGKRLVN